LAPLFGYYDAGFLNENTLHYGCVALQERVECVHRNVQYNIKSMFSDEQEKMQFLNHMQKETIDLKMHPLFQKMLVWCWADVVPFFISYSICTTLV